MDLESEVGIYGCQRLSQNNALNTEITNIYSPCNRRKPAVITALCLTGDDSASSKKKKKNRVEEEEGD